MVISGKEITEAVMKKLKSAPIPQATLAVFLVSPDSVTESFVKEKNRVADLLGVRFEVKKYSAAESEETLLREIRELGRDPNIGGIVLQLPLPENLDRNRFIQELLPKQDVDNLTGKSIVPSPAVLTVQEILKHTGTSLAGKVVAVIGQGILIGEPILEWLRSEPVKQIITIRRGDSRESLKNADIVITGAGQAGFINTSMLKEGVGVIDFGYAKNAEGKLMGDFDPTGAENISFYTPTPGGTGPILVSKLFENFYALNA